MPLFCRDDLSLCVLISYTRGVLKAFAYALDLEPYHDHFRAPPYIYII